MQQPSPIVSFIVALASDRAIGRDNDLPWRLPNDLKFFKKTTLGKPVLMGRKSFESIGSKPLKDRLNIVISSRRQQLPEGVLQYTTLEEGVARMKEEATDEVFIIGGGTIFEQALPIAQRMYLTRVDTTVPDASAWFPEVDFSEWELAWEERHEPDEKHAFAYTFQRWERR